MTDVRVAAYAASGVDVAAAETAVELLRRRLRRSQYDLGGGIGGFGAVLAIPSGYREPVMVTATDGVGTKTEIARVLGRLDTIGRDLVAMCADDVVCHGARPTFFLDYVAVGRVDPEGVARLVGGIADACTEIGCDLVGGETAEHPGVMAADAFDLAGFCVGFVERDEIVDGRDARAGDVVLGLASDGLHANGYSLVRALVDRRGLQFDEPFAGALRAHGVIRDDVPEEWTLGDELLRPTRLYSPAVLAMRDELQARGLRLGGLAHVTGGGLVANLPRAVPAHLGLRIEPRTWVQPSIFDLVAALCDLRGEELRATFNCGVGMAAVVEPGAVDVALRSLADSGVPAWVIGDVRPESELHRRRYTEAA